MNVYIEYNEHTEHIVIMNSHMSTTAWLSKMKFAKTFFRGHMHWWPQVIMAEAMANSFFQVMLLSIWLGDHQA